MFSRSLSSYDKRRVVVTGLGSLTCLGPDLPSNWAALLAGRTGIRPITERMDEEDKANEPFYGSLSSKVAGRVDPSDFASRRDEVVPSKADQRTMSRANVFSLIVAHEALKDAKLLGSPLLVNAGTAIGNGMTDLNFIGECDASLKGLHSGSKRGGAKLSPYFVPKILPNLNGGHVSMKFGMQGPSHCVSTACASGTHAIGDAFNFIKTGAADVMVAGASEACISPLSVAGFCKARALTTKFHGSSAEKASRPFDRDRDGFAIAEGASIMVLEELQIAIARGAEIYAEVLGYGLSSDAHHITAGRDDGEGAAKAMMSAARYLHNVDEEFDLLGVNAHATSTPKGDKAEVLAVTKFLQSEAMPENLAIGPTLFLTSHKGNIGHLLGGAGSTESAFVAAALKHGLVPATANIENLDNFEGIDQRIKILRDNWSWRSQGQQSGQRGVIVKNSFGFGGTNATLLFAEYR